MDRSNCMTSHWWVPLDGSGQSARSLQHGTRTGRERGSYNVDDAVGSRIASLVHFFQMVVAVVFIITSGKLFPSYSVILTPCVCSVALVVLRGTPGFTDSFLKSVFYQK